MAAIEKDAGREGRRRDLLGAEDRNGKAAGDALRSDRRRRDLLGAEDRNLGLLVGDAGIDIQRRRDLLGAEDRNLSN